MVKAWKWLKIGGWVIHGLLAALLLFAAITNLAGLRQVNTQFLLIQQRLHGLIVIIDWFSLLVYIAPLGGQGWLLICHLILRLRKM